ncbi:MAG: nucleoside hydrolase [Rhodospirillaceae bacterium]|nr:nucleoside hydrolase [Rhodospirillaceae bacterium]
MSRAEEAEMKVIIDTDPGQDDAAAIMLALGSPEIELLGVTAVAGNVPLSLTERNARYVCELSGRTDVRVFAGADGPLKGDTVTAEHAHGKTGLDGPEIFEPSLTLQCTSAIDFIVETLMEEPVESVTICAIGPLTNIALALKKQPEIGRRIKRIVLMGGGYFAQGNVTPSAEFNIYADPEAATIVFACEAPIVMMPLDVTHKILTTKERMDRLAAIGNNASEALVKMLTFYGRHTSAKYGGDGGPLHDPTTVAWLLCPDLFNGRMCNVEIETQSPLTRGATVVDWWGVTKRRKNALVVQNADAEGFFKLLTERVANLI